jgi:hypothetical protein
MMDGDRVRREPLAQPAASPPAGAGASEAPGAAQGSREWGSNHPVNIRLSVPLLFGRYYVTLVAGKERRSADRRVAERAKHPVGRLGNIVVFFALGVFIGLAGFAIMQLATAFVLMRSGAMVM